MQEQTDSQGPSAPVVELLEKGLTIMRAENESQQAMAVQKPRDVVELTTKALTELRAFPDFAKRAYYSIPYKDYTVNPPTTVMVEGLSIKAANALIRCWGNNASGFRVVGTDEDRIMIQGVCLDYETNVRRTAEMSVSRKARKRDGTYYALAPDRLNMAIQAGGSKAVRNAILNSLPVGLTDQYFGECKKIAARGGKPVDTTAEPEADAAAISAEMEKAVAEFDTLGVVRKEITDYVARHPELNSEESVVAHLIGVLNALKDGQTTVEEVFTVDEQPIAQPQATPKPVASAQRPQAATKPAPASWRPMKSKYAGSCETCKKPIAEGAAIMYNGTAKQAHHSSHFA